MQKVEELINGHVRLAAGTLYGAIENLIKLKFIMPVPSDDKRRKVYLITDMGRDFVNINPEDITYRYVI